MPLGLERRHNLGHLHFITFSCHNRLPYLDSAKPKEILEQVIERTRRSHNFLLYAYVLMPEHVHLLLSEPKTHSLSSTLRVIKGESSKLLKGTCRHFWQPRYYDQRLHHPKIQRENPIHPPQPCHPSPRSPPRRLRWSSFNHYATAKPSLS